MALDKDTEDMAPSRTAVTAADACWMDYCPCDTKDPDYGWADVSICRNVRGGVPVSDKIMSMGAQARDVRRQSREDREANPTRGYR